jgi:L-Ala-D/L-Glu epimerase
MQINTHTIALKSKYPFRIAHGVRLSTDTFIVELQKNGISGLGEATPVPYYGITPAVMDEIIIKNKNLIENADWNHPSELWEILNPVLNNTFVQCAIDLAAYDIWAKIQGKKLYETLGLKLNSNIKSNYTIGIDEPEIMAQKMLEYAFPIYKIKLGTAQDVEIVKYLRSKTDAVFRIDANCAWDVDEAVKNIEIFKNLNVEFIEQPLKADDTIGMRELKKHSSLPLMADESCIKEADVDTCFGLFDGINIKLAKCGGLTPALRMIENARRKNMRVMMGCMTETSIGISSIAHITPLLDYVDMDGALLISNDPAEGVIVENGNLVFPNRNGNGAIMKNQEYSNL